MLGRPQNKTLFYTLMFQLLFSRRMRNVNLQWPHLSKDWQLAEGARIRRIVLETRVDGENLNFTNLFGWSDNARAKF